MTTETASIMIEAIVGLIIAIFISMFYTWRMALATLSMIPFVILGAIMSAKF